jgi:hypothetical protein
MLKSDWLLLCNVGILLRSQTATPRAGAWKHSERPNADVEQYSRPFQTCKNDHEITF